MASLNDSLLALSCIVTNIHEEECRGERDGLGRAKRNKRNKRGKGQEESRVREGEKKRDGVKRKSRRWTG